MKMPIFNCTKTCKLVLLHIVGEKYMLIVAIYVVKKIYMGLYMGCGWAYFVAGISNELPFFGENWALLGHKISIGHGKFFVWIFVLTC